MQSQCYHDDGIPDLTIATLGAAQITSPLAGKGDVCVDDAERVTYYAELSDITACQEKGMPLPSFELAGPREKIFFDSRALTCGIVTCGGLCPGLNDVIRTITLALLWQYGVKKVLGFRYGYEGLSSNARCEPIGLTPSLVEDIQHKGGAILGTSRGPQTSGDMVDTLIKHDVAILFVIGGDGTLHGAHEIAGEIKKRDLTISVIGLPKTIDNDIYGSEFSFGFETAVEQAGTCIAAAHEEARAAYNGIGLVKLMGRDSGFIAATASLANNDVNFCLIPEKPFTLDGAEGLLSQLEKRLAAKHHAVIVVAEGAGQELIAASKVKAQDASGNMVYGDIGLFLKQEIKRYFTDKDMPLTLKYIDPSYTIRSCPADAYDSAFCLMLGHMAVHAGMAGKTDMFVGFWNHHFTHVPLAFAVGKRKKVDTTGLLWQTLSAMNR